jgi:hypothetical protein
MVGILFFLFDLGIGSLYLQALATLTKMYPLMRGLSTIAPFRKFHGIFVGAGLLPYPANSAVICRGAACCAR